MPSTPSVDVDATRILGYLGLPPDYSPSPQTQPVEFLNQYLSVMAFHAHSPHVAFFSDLLSPRQRTAVKLIKNRRTQYALNSNSSALRWDEGRNLEPHIWDSMNAGVSHSTAAATSSNPPPPRPGADAGDQEREWVESSFIGYRSAPASGSAGPSTSKGYVGRLGNLLAEYEEEREADRLRTMRRERAAVAAMAKETEEEFDSDSDSESTEANDDATAADEQESAEEIRSAFERVLRERFIDGLLNWDLYDEVDFSDKWDPDDRDEEERWFDEEEEG